MTISDIKKLREETGVGMMDCKKALEVSNGDINAAKLYLRKQGIQKAGDRGHKVASDGVIGIYKHIGDRICVMVEVNCETDSVANNEQFKSFAHDLAIHIAATDPKWISRADVPVDIIKIEREIISSDIKNKPENIKERIIEGKLNKFYKENCLMEQPFVKNSDITVHDLYLDLVMKIKEKIVIKRFVRFEVGK